MNKRLFFTIMTIGLTSMAGQIVLMRELLVVFYGNELSLGITLGSWLFWVGIGSWFIGRFSVAHIRWKKEALALGLVFLAIILPLGVFGSRSLPLTLHYLPGEIIGILPMIRGSVLLLSLICLSLGFLFVLGCGVYEGSFQARSSARVSSEKASSIGYVYIIEAAGATFGGLVTSLFLIQRFTPIQIMFLLGCLNFTCAFLILKGRNLYRIVVSFLLVIFLLVLLTGKTESLRSWSLGFQWRGYKLLAVRDSVYGNIAVTKKGPLYSVFTNGVYSFTVPDRFTSERNAHFPLLEHPRPDSVLMIGGGSSGQLREVLKHPVKRVDYVELDPLLIEMAKKYLPVNKSFKDPRVSIISNMDGRLYIKRAKTKYDVVVINLPGPYTAQLNRFYTKEFYEQLEMILKEGGLICFSMTSNPNYISDEQNQLYVTLKNTLESVFPEVIITPGETNYFLASKKKGILTLDWQVLMERLKERKIQADYMREYYLFSELSKERINFFRQRLSQVRDSTVNTDLRPVAYFYDLVLWNTYFRVGLKNFFKLVTSKRIYLFVGILYTILLLPIFIKRIKRRFPNWGVLTCVGTTGFAEITFQIITLISFQVIYGYVYYKLGLILSSYMLGLIIGGFWISKLIEQKKADRRLFIKTQFAITIYPLLLPLVLWLFLVSQGKTGFWLGSNLVFPVLPIIPGLIGGFQFPLANKLYLEEKVVDLSKSAGVTYGLDLLGSCAGAVMVSVFMLPIIGIVGTCFLVAGLNLVGLRLLLG